MQYYGAYTTTLNVPFVKQFQPDLLIHSLMGNPFTYVLGFVPFYLFVVLVVVGSSNAVNLTDGLDGLAIGLMVIAGGALTVLAYTSGNRELANYLQLARNPRTAELTIFCGSHDRREPRLSVVELRIRRIFSWATSDRFRWAARWAWSRC